MKQNIPERYKNLRNQLLQVAAQINKQIYDEITELVEIWEHDQDDDEINIESLFAFISKNIKNEELLIDIYSKAFKKKNLLKTISPDNIKIEVEKTGKCGMIYAWEKGFFIATINGEEQLIACHPFIDMGNYIPNYIAPYSYIIKIVDDINLEILKKYKYLIDHFRTGANLNYYFKYIILSAIRQNSSDIHIEYYPHNKTTFIKIRKDGFLHTIDKYYNPNFSWHAQLMNYIFVQAGINSGVFHEIHDKQIEIPIMGETRALRLSILPTTLPSGQSVPQVCIRIMVASETQLDSLDGIGFYPNVQQKLHYLIKQPNGIIFVCGPTGSGKNTTLYALLNILLNEEDIKILSVEDPVEKRLVPPENRNAGIIQVDVVEKRKLTFENILRSFLRHDPDVIFIGETRDNVTAQTAIKAALTGHLVFTTLHVNSSFDVIPRMVNTLDVEKELLASSLRGILSQRLIRKLCPHCKLTVPFSELLNSLDDVFDFYPDSIYANKKHIYNLDYLQQFDKEIQEALNNICLPVGCEECNFTGFLGRTAMPDILIPNLETQKYFFYEPDRIAVYTKTDSIHMSVSAFRLVQDQITSFDEIARFITPEEIQVFVKDWLQKKKV